MSSHNVRRVPLRFLARLGALAGTAVAVSVCGSQDRFSPGGPTAPGTDATPPVVQIILPTDTLIEIADSLKFTVNATDNSKLKSARVTVTGLGTLAAAVAVSKDTTFAVGTTVTAYTQAFVVPLPTNAAGGRIAISASATDGNDNVFTFTDTVRVNDAQAPVVAMLSPTAGVAVGSGDTIRVLARATDPSGVRYLGARLFVRDTVLGRVQSLAVDSLVYTSRQYMRLDSFRIVVPTSLTPGSYILQVFTADSSPFFNKGASADLAVAVRDIRAPTGTFNAPAVDAPIIAGDTLLISFHATDNVGLVSVRYRGYAVHANPLLGPPDTTLRFQALTAQFPLHPADTNPVLRRLLPVFADSTPDSVLIEATLTDIGGNVTTVTRRIQVVAGPFVKLDAPATGALAPVGTSFNVTVTGSDPRNVTYVGYTARGVVPQADSVAVSPAATSATRSLAWAVPAGAALGTDTVVPFAINAAGGRFTGTPALIAFADTVRPTVVIDTPAVAQLPVNVGDSVYARVHVRDNRGVTQLVLAGTAQRGSAALGTDTAVTRFVSRTVTIPPTADTVITRYLRAVVPADLTSEVVTITATATDSSGNSAAGTASVRVVGGPRMTLVRPTAGAITSPGRSIVIEVAATSTRGVRLAGWRATGVLTIQDSAFYSPVSGRLPQAVDSAYTIVIPASTPIGSFTIMPFGLDSIGDVSAGTAAVTVQVQSGASDVTPPTVSFSIGRRIEIDDSIVIDVRDAGGVFRVGWNATLLGTSTVVGTDTTASQCTPNCVISDASVRDPLNLLSTIRFPAQVVIQAFAWDSTGNRGVSPAETLTVVAGKTYALPAGSQIADAVYNQRRRELYLSNFAHDKIEVFSLASNAFVASITVGSRPWGIVLWPRATSANPADTLYADTLIVANSGGTNLSIVDLVSRREVRRHRLPNYTVQTVKVVDNGGGGKTVETPDYDFSDRPEHVAALCRAGGTTACDSVIVLYSTTPTGGQTYPPERGYLAWENLADTTYTQSGTGHLFWEQAVSGASGTDTLQVIRERRTNAGVLVSDTLLGGAAGVRVNLGRLGFQDTTFVRNSGNFLRAVVGEGGGGLSLARVLSYDVTAGRTVIPGVWVDIVAGQPATALSTAYTYDNGISSAHSVQDFLGNRASSVTGVAINFNGTTNLVRADSIYVFDADLRQTGMLQVSGAAHGMDLAPLHAFNANLRGTTAPGQSDARIVFAARPDSSIDVFDTYFFAEVTDTSVATVPIPIRNALVGAVRVTPDLTGTVLTGISNQGLVVVRLPMLANPFLSPAMTSGLTAAPPRSGSPMIVRKGARAAPGRTSGPLEE